MKSFVFLLILSVVGGGTEPLSTAPETLVQQLGAEDFAVREAASEALLKQGAAALTAVDGGTRSPDAEIAQRCSILLPKLRKLQLLEQIDAVRNGKEDIDLPLLKLYRRHVSADREAFELYASALVADPELFIQCGKEIAADNAEATKLIIEKRIAALVAEFAATSTPRGLQQDAVAKEFPERVVAAVLVAGLAKVETSDTTWETFPRVLLFSLAFRDRIKAADTRSEALRKLLEQWCLTAHSEMALTRGLRQLLLYERREAAAILARRVLDAEVRFNDVLRATAVDALGRYGKMQDDLARIIPLLDDLSEVWAGNLVSPGREVGDVAALSIVRLTGQKSQDYGISEAAIELSIGAVFAPGGGLAQALRCPIPGFESDDARQAAQTKLRKWLVENQGASKDLLVSLAPSTPAEFLAQARQQAEEKVFFGRRWKVWTRGASNAGVPFEATVANGKITFGGSFFQPGVAGSSKGATFDKPFGRAFIVTIMGPSSKVAMSAVDLSMEDRVVTTQVDCTSTSVFRYKRREVTGDTTTEITFDQRDDGMTAKVRRTANRDGAVILDKSSEAKDLVALRENSPDIFANSLEPLLSQLKIELPSKR